MMKDRQKISIFVLTGFFLMVSLSAPTSESSASPFDDKGLSELYSTELGKNEAAFMFLGYSGVIIRVGGKTILIDPSDTINAEDLDTIKQGGVDLLLFTHGHGDHFVSRAAKAIFQAGSPIVAANPALTHSIPTRRFPHGL
jgi:glyoxylase-like metal-dependent hydrolase (beta-lactamase superfamily II)